MKTSPQKAMVGDGKESAYQKFDEDFKQGAVALVLETGKPIAQVAREFGINDGTLGNWVAKARTERDGGSQALSEPERTELTRLRKENSEPSKSPDWQGDPFRPLGASPWSTVCVSKVVGGDSWNARGTVGRHQLPGRRRTRVTSPVYRRGIDAQPSWCHNGTMKRMNLRDVPDDVYEALVAAAQSSRQSLSAFVVERLTEVARLTRVEAYVGSYRPPLDSGVTIEDAAAAVREVREAS